MVNIFFNKTRTNNCNLIKMHCQNCLEKNSYTYGVAFMDMYLNGKAIEDYEDAKGYVIDSIIYIKQGKCIMEVLLAHFSKV